jgi:hypothetical protein
MLASAMLLGWLTAACDSPAADGSAIAGAGTPATGMNGVSQTVAGASSGSAGTGLAGGVAGSRSLGASGMQLVGGASGSAAVSRAGAGSTQAGSTGMAQAGSVAPVAGTAAIDPVSGTNTAAGFMNLAPALGAPLDGKGTTLSPAAPSGWIWYPIDGAICRDGSGTGFYVRAGTMDKLLIYLEGGGACSSPGFCSYNPANVNQILNGDGQTVGGSIGGAVAGRQQPGSAGIFDVTQAANPFKDWSQIYIPYCTGDVHFGTRKNVMLSGVSTPQQFVGYANMQKFISRIVPSFKDKVSRVVLTGASAGGFGALLNYSMVQDAFGSVLVTVLDDSGPSFPDNAKSMPVCLQKNWRTLWGFDGAFPPDCTECRQADGGGLDLLGKFLFRKHPNATIGVVSSMQDEVIRLFYSSGLKDCSGFASADPTTITLGQADPTVYMPGQDYTDGLNGLRMQSVSTGKFATYYLSGANITFHQHIWRQRFFDAAAGSESIAAWTTNLLAGKIEQIGP